MPCRVGFSGSGVGPTAVCSAAAAPPWAGAIFSAQEMSQVWGQVDERDGTGDQGYSASLREGVELDIQDLQACSFRLSPLSVEGPLILTEVIFCVAG